jgi:sugar phosphate isomerase/epimerase
MQSHHPPSVRRVDQRTDPRVAFCFVKLSISTLACPAWPLERIIMVAREHGIRGIDFRGLQNEIDITRLPAFTVDLAKTLALLKQAQMVMPCISTSVTLMSPAGDRWEAMIDECHRHAELAAATQTPFLRIFGGRFPKTLTPIEALLTARRRLRQIIKICRASNCRPLLETHDDWCTSAEILDLLSETKPTEAGVVWDMEHTFRRGEEPARTVTALRPYLAYVHIKDSARFGEKTVPRLLGEGDLPLDACMRALDQVQYRGWICLDTEKRWFAEAPEPDQSIPHYSAYMRQALRSVPA